MNIEKTDLEGIIIIHPDVFEDERGYFLELANEKKYQELLGVRFVQDNLSWSHANVVRGLHYQAPPFGQGKLVQVLKGKALDVAVDIRFGSPTFGRHVTAELSEENHKQLYVPEGFAHGFSALADGVLFSYKCTAFYSKESERGILWNDPALGIEWGTSNPVVAPRDAAFPLLADIGEDYLYHKT